MISKECHQKKDRGAACKKKRTLRLIGVSYVSLDGGWRFVPGPDNRGRGRGEGAVGKMVLVNTNTSKDALTAGRL